MHHDGSEVSDHSTDKLTAKKLSEFANGGSWPANSRRPFEANRPGWWPRHAKKVSVGVGDPGITFTAGHEAMKGSSL